MKQMRFAVLGFLVLGFIVDASAGAQAPQLTLRQAIDLALNKNPETTAAHAEQQATRASVQLARVNLLPQLNFTEDVGRGDDPVYAFGMRLRQRQFTQADFALNDLNRPRPLGNFSTRLSGSWMLFDFMRTEKGIRAARLWAKGSESSAKAVDQKIVLCVVQAYESVLYAERKIDLAEHEQKTAEALLGTVDEHVKAGLAAESDRMAAQVNLAARKQELFAAQGDLEIAWAELRVSLGDPEMPSEPLQPIEAHHFPALELNQEVATAAKSRPDLMAMSSAQSAHAMAVSVARSSLGPHIAAYGNWEEDRGSLTTPGGNNWVAGVQIGIDILPFGKRAEVAREIAVKQRVDAQVASYQQRVRMEVHKAHVQRATAELSMQTAQAALDQAAESMRIVRNRYAVGLATMTDLLRAEDAERQSQTNYWQNVYSNSAAYAELLYATGTLTPQAAEELQ